MTRRAVRPAGSSRSRHRRADPGGAVAAREGRRGAARIVFISSRVPVVCCALMVYGADRTTRPSYVRYVITSLLRGRRGGSSNGRRPVDCGLRCDDVVHGSLASPAPTARWGDDRRRLGHTTPSRGRSSDRAPDAIAFSRPDECSTAAVRAATPDGPRSRLGVHRRRSNRDWPRPSTDSAGDVQ